MRRFVVASIVLFLGGCAEHGSRPGGFDTSPFVPLLCTSGAPASPTCPITVLELDDVGLAGARFEMIVEPRSSDTLLDRVILTAGTDGLTIEGLQLVLFDHGDEAQTIDLTTRVQMRPAVSTALGTGPFSIAGTTPTQMSLRAASAAPL
jgi:hypothetical protein